MLFKDERVPCPDRRVVTAADGTGPLLQRDYWAIINGCELAPEQIMRRVRAEFPRFAPEDLVQFSRPAPDETPLSVGDEMTVDIKSAGSCDVRVVAVDGRSLTMQTLNNHPEAGRITFGARQDAQGRTVFRIRSRARANGLLNYLGYELLGKKMQARTWVTFIERVVAACGGRAVGGIRVQTREVPESSDDIEAAPGPTFPTRGTTLAWAD